MANVLQDAVKSITIETEWLPPIIVNDPFAPLPPGQTSVGAKAGSFLKPRITIETSLGPIVSNPWGDPTQNWPMLKTLALGLGLLGAGLTALHFYDRFRITSALRRAGGAPGAFTRGA